MIYKFFFFIIFLLLTGFIIPSTTHAGDGSITGWTIRMDFSDPSCAGSGLAAGPMAGAGGKWVTFTPTINTRGRCQIQVSGKGRVCAGSTNFSGTVNAGTSVTYNFSTCYDGGRATSWGITGDYEVVGPTCTPESTQTQQVACPAGQTGSITEQRTSSCPGPTWSGWSEVSRNCVQSCTPDGTQYRTVPCPAGQSGVINEQNISQCPGPNYTEWTETSRTCVTPTLTLTTNPTSAWAPGGTTISWNGANHPAGTTCTNTWNAFLNINPNSAGSDYRVLGPGNYTFTVNCSNGVSRSATFTVNQLQPPTIQSLSTGCNYSQPYVVLRLTAPTNYPGLMNINVYNYGSMSYYAYTAYNISPGAYVDIDTRNFTNYSALTPNNSNTFLATTSVSGLSSSNPASLPVFIPNCPSPPTISSVAPACNSGNYQPYDRVTYQSSTYGNPTAYHLDRKPGGQPFNSQGDGHIGTYGTSPNYIDDYEINNNTAYSYRMRAANGTYQSNPSAVVNTTSANCTPPTIEVSTRCIDNLTTPEYTITVTANDNIGRDMWFTMDRPGYPTLANVYLTGPGQSASRTFTTPPLTNGAVNNFSSYSWHSGIAGSYANNVGISAEDCSLPRPFNVSLNTTPEAICPVEGFPKLNVIINKSANAATYELYTYERDSSNQYTILVPAARRDYTSDALFPGVPIVSNSGTATRTFDVQPNKSYGVFVIARSSNGSWIYSNMATAMTAATPAVWSYATVGYCDTTPPTIQLASIAECIQPNQLPTNMQLTIVDNPGPGAPVGSNSGVNPASIRFRLNELNVPDPVQKYTHQNVSGNIYSRVFTDPDFFAGVDKDYELSATACDMNNKCSTMNKVGVSYARVCGAWIQTRQGNVHSEKEINAPGGP